MIFKINYDLFTNNKDRKRNIILKNNNAANMLMIIYMNIYINIT